MTQKNASRKGFTLVEVIVVLVILAILAAIMIPAMTGWIDKAREKRLVTACRACVTAAQTLVAEAYAETDAATIPDESDVKALAGVPGGVSNISLTDTAVATLTYTDNESSDYVTYVLSPGPKYVYGTGLTAGQAAEKLAQGDNSFLKTNGGTIYSAAAADGAYARDDRKWVAGIADYLAAMPADVVAGLSEKTWVITRGANPQLIVYDGTITKEQAGTQLDVQIYDLTTGASTDGKRTAGSATVSWSGGNR